MTLSMDGHPGDVSRRVTYLSARSPARPTASAGKANRLDDPWANQMESQVVDLKRRIPILKRLIDDCDRWPLTSIRRSETRKTASESMIPRIQLIRSTPRRRLRDAII